MSVISAISHLLLKQSTPLTVLYILHSNIELQNIYTFFAIFQHLLSILI